MKPVAWMFRGYLYEKDPSDWTVHEHPDVPVIPLYTHPAKELGYNDIMGTWWETMPNAKSCEGVFEFARAILRKAQDE
jgi:hypothetical protein